jgi:hypothetical protein
LDHFYKINMEIIFTSNPFEVLIRVERQTNHKKRPRPEIIDLDDDPFDSNHRKKVAK